MRIKRVIKNTKVAKIRPVEPEVLEPVENELYSTIRRILAKARASAYVAVNSAMVEAYWNVGREIVGKQGGERHAKYGDALVKTLATRLTADFGAGFTAANLFNMRQFYLTFPNFYTLCRELSWSHYRLLMRIEDEKARQYYLDECTKSHWSVRLLQRQIDTQFYQRLMRNRIDPKSLKALVKRDSAAVKDIIRSPAILEFSGITAAHYQEKDLETALIKNMRLFLMELGRGFALDAEQKPIRIGDETYHCDLVKYTLNEHERNLFAVKYHLELPTVEELRLELNRERAAIEEALAMRKSDARSATTT